MPCVAAVGAAAVGAAAVGAAAVGAVSAAAVAAAAAAAVAAAVVPIDGVIEKNSQEDEIVSEENTCALWISSSDKNIGRFKLELRTRTDCELTVTRELGPNRLFRPYVYTKTPLEVRINRISSYHITAVCPFRGGRQTERSKDRKRRRGHVFEW